MEPNVTVQPVRTNYAELFELMSTESDLHFTLSEEPRDERVDVDVYDEQILAGLVAP